MLDAGEVRKRLRHTIEAAKRDAAARRAALSSEQQAFDAFLENHAVPVLRLVASALKAEGHVFQVLTPAGTARLQSDRERDDFLEVVLDGTKATPTVIGRFSYVRGSQLQTAEQALGESAIVSDLTDEDVFEWVLRVILPFVER
ncbi:MAG: hypothetical protein ABIT71_19370 [Vicinamibacteraceae bacterium]